MSTVTELPEAFSGKAYIKNRISKLVTDFIFLADVTYYSVAFTMLSDIYFFNSLMVIDWL